MTRQELEIGQTVYFNWKDGLMSTKVIKLIKGKYLCFMPMTNRNELFSREELSETIYRKAKQTAFRNRS